MHVRMRVAAFICEPSKICGTSAKIIQLNEWGCRDGMHHAKNRGNPPSNTIKDTIIILKEFIVDVWEVRKQKLYGEDTCPSHHQCQTLAGDAGPVTGGGGLRVSRMGRLQDKGKLGKLGKFHVQVCSGNVHAI